MQGQFLSRFCENVSPGSFFALYVLTVAQIFNLAIVLFRGFRIQAIKHEGLDLPKYDFDKMIKTAAGMLASKCICAALGIKPEEEHYRFGFAA